MSHIPKAVFFVKGKGYSKSKLVSLEQALRDAGIEKYNLVDVSSILPPGCKEISKEEGLAQLSPGQIVYTVWSRISNNEPNKIITASIGVAKPVDQSLYGYLAEYHERDIAKDKANENAEHMALEMLSSILGIDYDSKKDYSEIIETKHFTKSGSVREDGEWCTVVAAAVFIL